MTPEPLSERVPVAALPDGQEAFQIDFAARERGVEVRESGQGQDARECAIVAFRREFLEVAELAAEHGQPDAGAARAAGVRFAWASYGFETAAPPGTDRVLARFADVLDL